MTPPGWQQVSGVRFAVERTTPGGVRPTGPTGAFWIPRIAELMGVGPESIAITGDPGSRPGLSVDGLQRPVSFSRSVGARACVVGSDHPVGIDIEARIEHAEARVMLRIAAKEHELEEAAGVFGDDACAILLRLWTAKEAALKAMGVGLHVEPATAELHDIEHGGCTVRCRGNRFSVRWIESADHLTAIAREAI